MYTVVGIEPKGLVHAVQALYQLSYVCNTVVAKLLKLISTKISLVHKSNIFADTVGGTLGGVTGCPYFMALPLLVAPNMLIL